MLKNNCYGCEKRYVGCHSKCEIYEANKNKTDKIRTEKIKERKVITTHRKRMGL